MALAKLWNAVFGKRSESSATEPTETLVPSSAKPLVTTAVAKPSATKPPVTKTPVAASTVPESVTVSGTTSNAAPVKLSRKKTKSREAKKPVESAPVAVEPAPVLRMFRRKNNAWTKLIGSRTVTAILDTQVGDGSRAVEILESLVDSNTPTPKYIAIGMFEMGGEKLSVRQFHQKIRSAGGQPIVIPMALEEGLRRLSQTIGTVDLVLLNGVEEASFSPGVVKLLARVAPAGCLILRSDANGRWTSAVGPAKPAESRRAA
jgi:hypothetical protein